jgi:signal transduction histidine kinase
MNSDPSIPWPRISAFIRQHMHDVRNGLNLIHLEAEILQDCLPAGEAAAGVKNISRQLQSMDKQLRCLTAFFHEPLPVRGPAAARAVMQVFQSAHADLAGAPAVQWIDELEGQEVSVDTELLPPVFRALLQNAAVFSADAPLTVLARASDRELVIELRELKKEPVDTSNWGQPFFTTRHDGYGLGLWSAHRILQANGGTLTQYCADGCLISRMVFPLTRTTPDRS